MSLFHVTIKKGMTTTISVAFYQIGLYHATNQERFISQPDIGISAGNGLLIKREHASFLAQLSGCLGDWERVS